MGKTLESQGGWEFITMIFFNFVVYMSFYFVILYHGAWANHTDFNFKEIINQLHNDAMLVKKLANDGIVFEKDGVIEILIENEKGQMIS